jgi:hypothetical protein
MSRKSIPAHLRKSGPGTGGRKWDRDQEIYALKASTGMSNEAIGEKYNLSGERVAQVLRAAERNKQMGRTRWMSTAERRAEIAKEQRNDLT